MSARLVIPVQKMTPNKSQTAGPNGADFPKIPGVTLRRYGGEKDLQSMADVMLHSRRADGVEFLVTVNDLAAQYRDHVDFDPEEDILVAESEGTIIGLARVWREDRRDGRQMYGHTVELLPEWRGRGIREQLFLYNEKHIRKMAGKAGGQEASYYLLWANDSENDWKSIVERNGYRPVQHELEMVRGLDDIPDMPLPEGFEVRPVRPDDYAKVWGSIRESSLLDWDFSESRYDEEHFRAWMKRGSFQPELWQTAWDGDTLAGTVLNYIIDEENRELGRKAGHTEDVFVKEQYRHRGLARALLARSFRVLKERGMDEATLGMEVENPHDPLRLYEGMGYRTVRHFTWYQKRIA